MQKSSYYVRVVMDQVPDDKKQGLAFRTERNYPVLGLDAEKNRLLLPDDTNKLIWVPLGLCRFVKLA